MSCRAIHVPYQFCCAGADPQLSQILSVKEVLASCSPDTLLRSVLEDHVGWHASIGLMPGAACHALRNQVASSLDLMASLEAAPAPRGLFIVPWQWFATLDERGCFRRSMGAALVDPDRIFAAEHIIAIAENRQCSVAEVAHYQALLGGADPLEALMLSGALIELDELAALSWPCILGMNVWVPDTLTTVERHALAAHIFWTMTYRGFGAVSQSVEADGGSGEEECWSQPDATHLEKLDRIMEALNIDTWIESLTALKAVAALMDAKTLPASESSIWSDSA